MKPFRFTLEAVRIVRQRHEQLAMEEYAQALFSSRQAEDQLEAVRRELDAGCEELRKLLAKSCPVSKAAQTQQYLKSVEKRLNECARALEQAKLRADAALDAMLAARQQREIVDKFFARQKTRHEREELREEQKLLDELAGRRPTSILSWNPTGAMP
jgi:flagellar export protein FliJ